MALKIDQRDTLAVLVGQHELWGVATNLKHADTIAAIRRAGRWGECGSRSRGHRRVWIDQPRHST
jgi:hypothetical protein